MVRTLFATALGLSLTTSASIAAAHASDYGFVRTHDAPSDSATVAFTIKITRAPSPTAPALRRARPLYVSPSTESLTLLVDGASPVRFNVTSTSRICYPINDYGVYACRVAAHVTPGVHTFTVEAFDGLNSTGNLLSHNTTGPIAVAATGTTYVALALEGVVAKVTFAPSIPVPDIGVSTTISLNLVAYDADGNIIIGGASYDTPISIATMPQGALSLSKNVISSPADASALTAAYPGTDVSKIVIAASIAGKPFGATTLTPMPRTTAKLYVEPYGRQSIQIYRTANLALPPATIPIDNYATLVADPAVGRLFAFDASYTVFRNVAYDLETLVRLPGSFSLPGYYNFAPGVADDSGLLYYANANGTTSPVVSVDPRNGYRIATVIADAGPGPIALDSPAGRLYVGSGTHGNPPADTVNIYALATGSASLIDTIVFDPTLRVTGVAVDPATERLYVSTTNQRMSTISVYSTMPGHALLSTIRDVSGVFDLAVDSVHGRLYVAEGSPDSTRPNEVRVFATNAGNAFVGALHVPFYYQSGAIAVVP